MLNSRFSPAPNGRVLLRPSFEGGAGVSSSERLISARPLRDPPAHARKDPPGFWGIHCDCDLTRQSEAHHVPYRGHTCDTGDPLILGLEAGGAIKSLRDTATRNTGLPFGRCFTAAWFVQDPELDLARGFGIQAPENHRPNIRVYDNATSPVA